MELEKCQVSYEPFTSIDIECTGLDYCSHTILEVGAAFYDGVHKQPVKTIEFLCIPDNWNLLDVNYQLVGHPIAFSMNKALLDEITEAQRKCLREHPEWEKEFPDDQELRTAKGQLIVHECVGMTYLHDWMSHIQTVYGLKKKHILAGKNLNSLDIPFLKRRMGDFLWNEVVGFRTLDLTSMFAAFSRKTSPLKDINALRGLGTVSHRALQDAMETGAAVIDIYEKNLQW